MDLSLAAMAKMIDHAILQPTATGREVEEGCALARRFQVATVCVKPYYVPQAYELLKNSTVQVSTVIGFLHGGQLSQVKSYEAILAMEQGAAEIDMVCNIGAVKSGDWEAVRQDIRAVVVAARERNVPVKVILEICYLTEEEKRRLCLLIRDEGAAFVKTSTGFGTAGATVEDVRLLRSIAGPALGIKAAGGIRTLDDLQQMVAAGATRIGTSSTAAILEEAARRGFPAS
ncbi:MAG: deoxyribose-phosphate aldolase [Chloroflexi bacterium]|nr:deoxyribose-phosphate aldolase [Chloroflexota bacterium]